MNVTFTDIAGVKPEEYFMSKKKSPMVKNDYNGMKVNETGLGSSVKVPGALLQISRKDEISVVEIFSEMHRTWTMVFVFVFCISPIGIPT